MAFLLSLIITQALHILKYIHLWNNLLIFLSFKPAVSLKMNRHSLHISMAFRNRLVLRRKLATIRPIGMTCITSSALFISNTSVDIKQRIEVYTYILKNKSVYDCNRNLITLLIEAT